MTAKHLRYSNEAREALHRGVDSVANAVSVTLGPRGRNVVIDKRFGAPLIINDGVTIARDLDFKDPFENMGAQLLKEIAVKTNDIAGDGTTTATVLGRALINEGLRNLAAGASPTELRRGMLAAAEAVAAAVRSQSHPVAGNEDLERVATISSGDEVIGTMVAEAFERVGREGVVTVEEGNGIDTEVEVVEGMQFDRGYVSPYLVTDQKTMEAVLENAAVLVTDAKITAVADLLPVLELVVQSSRPLLILAEDVQAEALATLVVNRLRGSFTAVAVKAPAFGDRRTAILADIAVLTGATVISEKIGLRLDGVRLDQLGSVERAVITKEDTTLLKGGGDRAALDARAADLRREIEETESEWDREKLQERLAPPVGGAGPGTGHRRGQGRRRHRGGDEGAQVPRRGRSCRGPRRARRRLCGGRRSRASARCARHRRTLTARRCRDRGPDRAQSTPGAAADHRGERRLRRPHGGPARW